MNRTMENGKILILSKDAINKMFMCETEYNYKIIQIEPSFDNDYMVEVIEKGSGVTMVPVSDLNSVVKNLNTISRASSVGDKE